MKYSKRKVGTLIVIGITDDGYKEVLHFTMGTESEKHFDEVLQSLIEMGCYGIVMGVVRDRTSAGQSAVTGVRPKRFALVGLHTGLDVTLVRACFGRLSTSR